MHHREGNVDEDRQSAARSRPRVRPGRRRWLRRRHLGERAHAEPSTPTATTCRCRLTNYNAAGPTGWSSPSTGTWWTTPRRDLLQRSLRRPGQVHELHYGSRSPPMTTRVAPEAGRRPSPATARRARCPAGTHSGQRLSRHEQRHQPLRVHHRRRRLGEVPGPPGTPHHPEQDLEVRRHLPWRAGQGGRPEAGPDRRLHRQARRHARLRRRDHQQDRLRDAHAAGVSPAGVHHRVHGDWCAGRHRHAVPGRLLRGLLPAGSRGLLRRP